MSPQPGIQSRLLVFVTLAVVSGAGSAAPPTFNGAAVDSYQTVANAMAGSSFDSRTFWFDIPGSNIKNNWVSCYGHAQRDGQNVRGIPITANITTFNTMGEPINTLEQTKKTNNPEGYAQFSIPTGTPRGEDARASAFMFASGNKKLDRLGLRCVGRQWKRCVPGDETLCLDGDRFTVEVDWRTADSSGQGMVVDFNEFDGSFYFFNPDSTDLVVQLLQQCSINDHFWVFAAATTDVEFDITVTDTQSGSERVYGHPLGAGFEPILDTSAFATCP